MLTSLFVITALLAAMCALNLSLILRLSAIVRQRVVDVSDQPHEIRVGARMPEFQVTTIHGRAVGRDDLPGAALVGFFTPSCKPCHEIMPEFTEAARQLLAEGDRVLAMVRVHPQDDLDETLAELAGIDVVIIPDERAHLLDTFHVERFPIVLRYDEHRVTATGHAAVEPKVPALL